MTQQPDDDCPACGCNDWQVLRSESTTARVFSGGWIHRVMRTFTVRVCGHCGHRWRSTETKPIEKPAKNLRPPTPKPQQKAATNT